MKPNASNRGLWPWASLSPLLLFYAVLTLLPVLNLMYMSTEELLWVDGQAQSTWVGMAHWRAVADDGVYLDGLRNTLWFAVVSVSLQMVLGFGLALAVTRVRRGGHIYRMVFLLPILMPGIVIGAIWKLMYDADFGVINQMLGLLNIAPQDWTGSRALAMPSIIVVDVWHWTPFVFLLMLAGLESLPQDVFEAARVDGTPWWRELLHITLPLMLPTLIVTLVFRTVLAFKVFDEIYLLTSGGPGTATEVISFSIFRNFFVQGRVGYGAALSLVTLSLIALCILTALQLQARLKERP